MYHLNDLARMTLSALHRDEFGDAETGTSDVRAYNKRCLDAIQNCPTDWAVDDDFDFGDLDESALDTWRDEWVVMLCAEYHYGMASDAVLSEGWAGFGA